MIFTVPPSLAAERIDRVISFAGSCTRAESAQLIGAGEVRCNGVAVSNRSRRVAEGDVIVLRVTGSQDMVGVIGEDNGLHTDPSWLRQVISR